MFRALFRLTARVRSRRAIAGCSTIALSLAILSTEAHAQQGDDKAAADALFEQGRSLMNGGQLTDACPKFEESLRLDRAIGSMLYLAECYQRSGKTASAWAEFREAQNQAMKEGDPRQKVAEEHAQRLAPILSTLVIEVTKPAPAIKVARDEREVGAPAWGTETPIDPGPHTLKASAPGFRPWQTTITVGARADHVKISVPPLTSEPSPAPPPVTTTKEVVATRSWQKVLGGTLAVVGVAGLGIGTGFGLSAISKNNSANDHCPSGACDGQGIDDGRVANQQGNVSTIAFVAGAALIVGGVVLFFTASHRTTQVVVGSQDVTVCF